MMKARATWRGTSEDLDRHYAAADQREFNRQKARFRDAILHDQRLTSAEQRIGYEIADCLNCQTGDAWPSQHYLARRSGYCVRTVERATKRLAGADGLWFRREIDGKGYRYFPKLDQLARVDTRQNVGGRPSTSVTKTADNGDQYARQNVGLSSLRTRIREPIGVGRQIDGLAPALSKTVEREEKVATTVVEGDREITAQAVAGGAPRFVFEGSEPWRAWTEYRERKGISGPLPTRQHMVNGRFRTGWDAPTLWPPGYGRVRRRLGR